MPAAGRVASSTVVQPIGSQTRPTIIARSLLAVRQVFFTSKDVQDPERLWQILRLLQQNFAGVLHQLTQVPFLNGSLQTGLVFTGGTTLNINHGLGRAYQGFFCVRAQGSAWAGVEQALPTGVTAAQQIALQTPNNGTFSLWIF